MPSISYTLHPLKDQYLSEAEQLMEEFPTVFSVEDRQMWRKNLLEYLLKKEPPTFIYVVADEEHVQGAIMFHEDHNSQNHYWEIDWLVVQNAAHGKGYGRALVEKAFEVIKSHGGEHCYLYTSEAHYNQYTKGFYKKMKFERQTVMPRYYPSLKKGKSENAILFYRHLS